MSKVRLRLIAAIGTAALFGGCVVNPTSSTQPSPGQTLLPFGRPHLYNGNSTGIAVDRAGAVYVAAAGDGHVLKLDPGAAEPVALTFPGLDHPSGVAVDAAGTVFAIQGEYRSSRLARLSPGKNSATELPTSSAINGRLAVDAHGVVYVAGLKSVERLTPNAASFEELPKPSGDFPQSVAVDGSGALYVLMRNAAREPQESDFHIWKLGGASYTDLTPAGLRFKHVNMIAVDSGGTVYFTANDQVAKLAPGTTAPAKLPVTDLMGAFGIAVGADGSVYVSDIAGGRVVRLPPAR